MPFPPEAKVAFIDLQVVVRDSKLGKQGQEAMKVLNDKLGAAARRQEQGNPGAAGKDEDAAERGERCRVQRHGQGARADAAAKRSSCSRTRRCRSIRRTQELLADFQAKVLPLVEELRKEKGLWIIFALGENSNIAAAHAGLDLSAEIVKRLDATVK